MCAGTQKASGSSSGLAGKASSFCRSASIWLRLRGPEGHRCRSEASIRARAACCVWPAQVGAACCRQMARPAGKEGPHGRSQHRTPGTAAAWKKCLAMAVVKYFPSASSPGTGLKQQVGGRWRRHRGKGGSAAQPPTPPAHLSTQAHPVSRLYFDVHRVRKSGGERLYPACWHRKRAGALIDRGVDGGRKVKEQEAGQRSIESRDTRARQRHPKGRGVFF